MAKMWAGRFAKETDSKVDDFNTSLPFDCRMYEEDIQGSLAHVAMLKKQGIVSSQDAEDTENGLKSILHDINEGKLQFEHGFEDIHMFVEETLTNRVGDAGKRLHTGRSRNDQVALDMRLYVKKEIKEIQSLTLDFMNSLTTLAKQNLQTYIPGYTHLQRAQPITVAHWMMAYANMLKRDVKRLENTYEIMNECPLGCGALATTTYPVDREYTSDLLGFRQPVDNSLDGVSDRDYCIELCSDLSILMMHLSRFSEEIIAWCSLEFHYIELDDAYSTGSSIMPQKKNPDICELIRGKTGRVYGSLMTSLTMLKGLPLAYNKDMQEDKEAVYDAIDTVKQCLVIVKPMFDTMTILKENCEYACLHGYINATDCADYLTRKGLPFRDAYHVVGALVGYCNKNHIALNELTLEQFKEYNDAFDEDVYAALDIQTCVENRKVLGGPSHDEVVRQIHVIEKFVSERCS